MISAPPKKIRRKRDPGGTREAILQAARKVLAHGGKEGLSVAEVAQRAGVNRGTAYQHFQTREQLIEATAAWVSDKLYRAVFGHPAVASQQSVENVSPKTITEHLAAFAMENPELGRVWLFELLSSQRPASDPFWQQYRSSFEAFAKTELGAAEYRHRGGLRALTGRGLPVARLGAFARPQRAESARNWRSATRGRCCG